MKEIILFYGFREGERFSKIKRALFPLGMRMKAVEPSDYSQPVGFLAGVKEIPASETIYDGEEFENEMMVLAGLASSRVDAVIYALRKAGVGRIDYKAVLTPTNQYWDAVTLYGEIAREHEAMSGRKPAES